VLKTIRTPKQLLGNTLATSQNTQEIT